MGRGDRNSRRRRSPPFVMLYHSMTNTPAWADLSGNAVKLLVHLVKLHDGTNNGELFLSVREGAKAIGVANNTAVAAFADLEEHGFIRVAAQGQFTRKLKMATSWRLTFVPAGAMPPTNDFRDWREQNPRSQ